MKSHIFISDLQTGGTVPLEGDMFIDNDAQLLKIKCDQPSIKLELWLKLCDIGEVLGDELHG